MNSRVIDEVIEINSERVNSFFENRFCEENPLASVMVRATADDSIAEKRNKKEIALVKKNLQGRTSLQVLDLGCGVGRWVENIREHVASYIGIDFCQKYINAANELYKDDKKITFLLSSVTELDKSITGQHFDLIVVNGLCVYLNDKPLSTVLNHVNTLLKPNGILYFRESVSTFGKRLTLNDFFSDELMCYYSAIYRTPSEYRELLKNSIPHGNILSTGLLLDKKTGARRDTNQQYWVICKEA